MRAQLRGLDDVPWDRLHSNVPIASLRSPVPDLLRRCAEVASDQAFGPFANPWYQLGDALCHQGTRFGGAAEALPFLLEMVAVDETARRADLLLLAARIGAPVGSFEGVAFDRERLSALTARELWENDDPKVLDGYASMCAHDARARWIELLPTVAVLANDPDPALRRAVRKALQESRGGP